MIALWPPFAGALAVHLAERRLMGREVESLRMQGE